MVEYAYDSWGKQLSCIGTLAATLGVLNPFRYRGYVYDEETQWYYLKSRYYDPETCRFISADVLLSTGQGVLGHNCYAYCLSNPIRFKDTFGKEAEENEDEPAIIELIKTNIKKAKRHSVSIYYYIPTKSCIVCQRMQWIQFSAIAGNYAWFALKVRGGGPMDYKIEKRWKKALPGLAFEADCEKKVYKFNGSLISTSDLGNINYGVVGAAMGIPLDILLWQAGAAQLRKAPEDGGEGLNFQDSEIVSLERGPRNAYGDQIDDYEAIKLGFNLYMGGYFG